MKKVYTSTCKKKLNSFETFKLPIFFEENKGISLIPDLVEIQQSSFQDFIEFGLADTLNKINPLIFSHGEHFLKIKFFPEFIRFRNPEVTLKQTFRFGKTYGSAVYVPAFILSSQTNEYKIEWVLLGFLPLMTRHGHFLINGIPRVVLHQMVRNPGIYTLPNDSRTRVPTIRIVPEQGSWINITVDKKERVWVTTRILRRKVSILVFLQALGISISTIYKRIDYSEMLEGSFIKKRKSDDKTRHDSILIRANLNEHPKTQAEAWRYLYAHFQEYTSQGREQKITDQTAHDFFWQVVWNPKNRKIGFTGRDQFRKKLDSSLLASEIYLKPDDIVLATQALIKLIVGERLADDIDSLTNKRIRGCGDFLQDEFLRGLKEFEVLLSRKYATKPVSEVSQLWQLNRSILSKSVSKAWKSFFTSGTLSQFMDETNPLAETTHKRRVTVLGPGGVSSKQTTIKIRGIHPTYYGRLCPIETPEGQNAGLVNSFTLFTRRNSLGTLETPFYNVYKGQVQKNLDPLYCSPQDELFSLVAPADICVSQFNILPKTQLPVRKNWNFEYALWYQITKQSVGILQMISVATSLIPFLEHDDANRALMGSNMQRQAVPLIKPEVAFVRTGLESRVITDIHHSLQTLKSGYLTEVTSNHIRIYQPELDSIRFPKTKIITRLTDKKLDSNIGFYGCKWNIWKCQDVAFVKKEPVTSVPFSNIFIPFQNILVPNETFGSDIETFGKTQSNNNVPVNSTKSLKVIVGSQSLHSLDFPMKHLEPSSPFPNETFGTENCDDETKTNIVSRDKSYSTRTTTSEYSYHLDQYQRTNQSTCISQKPLIDEGQWIQQSSIIADGAASVGGNLALGKNILVAYLPWEGYNFEDAILISERLVTQDIFTSLHIDHYEVEVKNTQYGLETITNQVPVEVNDSSRDLAKLQRLSSEGIIEIGSWVQEGDYLVGKITPLSPKGPSVQQQYEKLYNVIMQRENANSRNTSLRVPKGVEGFVLDIQFLPPKEADVLALAPRNAILRVRVALLQRRKIQVGDKMAGRHGNKGVISKILPIQDMPYLPDGTPIDIILNPLGVPSRMNVGQILECLLGLAGKYLHESYTIQLFDEMFGAEASRSFVYSKLYEASLLTSNPWLFEPHHPGKIKIFDGRTGDTFNQAVTIGYAYMLKLVHLVDDKIHARATGPYSAITQQPVRGRSRNGGQRLGEMEVWALQAYGAAYTLQELLTIKSDDVDGRKEAVFRIYTNQSLVFGPPESFKVLLRELQALCFDLNLYSEDSKSGELKPFPMRSLEHLG
jgi:DNA-directed RNA polymerase beta subunit